MEKKKWLTPDELHREFGIAKDTQAKYRMERKIPFSKIGKFIRYNRDHIDQWLSDHCVMVRG